MHPQAEGGVMAPSHGWNFSRLEGVRSVFGAGTNASRNDRDLR
jgi:hypothetical protein